MRTPVQSEKHLQYLIDKNEQLDLYVSNGLIKSSKSITRFTDNTLMVFHDCDGSTNNYKTLKSLLKYNKTLADALDKGYLFMYDWTKR